MELVGTEKMTPMSANADALRRLADAVTRRRTELRLLVNPAARLAGITNKTWKKVEDGESVRGVTYAAMEPVLRWKQGSCEAVLDGGEATILDDQPAAEAPDAEQPQLLGEGEGYEEWSPVVATDLRDAVRDAVMVVLPGTTGTQIQEMERAVEDALRRRLALRRRDSA